MIEKASVVFLFAETPVHAGAGGTEAAIDLPVQRSVQTGWPILNDSTVRGGFRRACGDKADEWFGTEEGDDRHPGWLTTPDAELLWFPVAAAKGLVGYVTCVPAIQYFVRKVELFKDQLENGAQKALKELKTWLTQAGDGPAKLKAWVPDAGSLPEGQSAGEELLWVRGQGQNVRKYVILESDSFEVEEREKASRLAEWMATYALPLDNFWASWLKKRLVVLHHEGFSHYVKTKTDIRTRVRIVKGRAADTGLWTEENLPPDSLLYTVVAAYNWTLGSPTKQPGKAGRILEDMRKKVGLDSVGTVIQLGGDQNLGRGLLRLRELRG